MEIIKHFLLRGVIFRCIGMDGGICYLATPHGSIIKIGSYYMANDSTELAGDERIRALELIKSAKAKGKNKSNRQLMNKVN